MNEPQAGVAPPYLTTAQMIEVDRTMIEDYGIALVQMMENAGCCLAHLARSRFLSGDARGRSVVVLAGAGGNGGGAQVGARRLAGWGASVRVFVTGDDTAFAAVPAHQLDIVRRMGVPVGRSAELDDGDSDLIVDGVVGYSLKGVPHGEAADLIRWANARRAPVLSLDIPSGVDSTTGTVFDPAVAATATMTLALPKKGVRAPGVAAYVGELYVADIGVPPSLYAGPTLGLKVGPLVALEEIFRLA